MSTNPSFDHSAFTVLVVDDAPATLSMLAKHLEENNLQVVVAEEGEEAVERARIVRPDLILLDVMLPGADGFETCRRLKADKTTQNIPVIFMTALTDTQSKIAGFEVGGVDYVTKPIQLEEVMARVQTHLTLHALRRELELRVAERTTALAQANRMLRILSDCNQTVVRANAEPELLQEICRIIVDIGGYPLAWVGFTEQDEAKTVRPKAHKGCEEGYLPTAHISWADTELGQGPTGRAIRSAKPCIVQDIRTDPGFAPWREESVRHGFGSVIALPLRSEDVVFGTLTIYATQTDAFHDQEVELLTELAGDLAYGIRSLRSQIAHALVEEKLRELKEFNEGIVQNMAEGLIAVDDQGQVTFVNPALAACLSDAPGKLLGRLWTTLIPFDQQAIVGGADGQPGRTVVGRYELELTRKDDTRVPVLASISRHSSGNHSSGHLIVFTDLSERKQLENQLLQAQKMEAVGRLAGGVAHDFNNLLTVIMGFSDLLQDSFQPDDPRRLNLEEIRKAAERAEGLTRQLLAFSRRQVLQPRVMDLNSTLDNLEKMLRRLIGEDIELQTLLASPLPCIKADPGQIEQVLLNLAVNARDAMPQGGKLVIETRAVTLDDRNLGEHPGMAPGAYVMLAAGDNGTGIKKEILAHIFEPFFTTKPEGKGTGLGLSTVYGIVKQSGGHIEVDSEPGRGSTFRIYLPAAVAKVQPDLPAQSATASSGTETILLVEDEAMVRNMARRVLQNSGYRVLDVRTGDEALTLSAQHPDSIHLLLTDMVLPGGMSGWDLRERLLTLRPDLKVLCMSGYVCDQSVQHGIVERGIPFLQKPFKPSDLTRKVREVLEAPDLSTG